MKTDEIAPVPESDLNNFVAFLITCMRLGDEHGHVYLCAEDIAREEFRFIRELSAAGQLLKWMDFGCDAKKMLFRIRITEYAREFVEVQKLRRLFCN